MIEITERNTGMWRRIKRCKAAGLDMDQATTNLFAWNSFMPEPLTKDELQSLIEEVYSDNTVE